MGAAIVIAVGCFIAWCSVSMIRKGYFVGRVFPGPTRTKRYYKAGHPLEFWLLAAGGLLLAILLIGSALIHLSRE